MKQQRTIVIERDVQSRRWRVGRGDAESRTLPFYEKAGDLVQALRERFPDARIGVSAYDIGPATVRLYGAVVWMKD